MRFRLIWGLAAMGTFVMAASAQQTLTVEQLLSFIRSSIQLKQPDRQVAAYVAKLKLSEKLDARTVEELQGEGAGPKTVAALNELAAASASLPQARLEPKTPKPAPPPIPPPPPEEQQDVISQIREYAMNYSQSLPDFICTEVLRRYVDQSNRDDFHPVDTLMAHLTFFDQKENYKLTMVNNHYVDMSYASVGGAMSMGDFGSMLKLTLSRKADALIEFERWGKLRGRLCYVFAYLISSGNSDYSILWEKSDRIIVGYRGLIYVDKETRVISRIVLEAVGIPSSFPVREAREILDYDYVKIADREFMLPLKAQVFMSDGKTRTRNDKEFRLYQKYSADAKITFETPDPLPDDQTKEQPPK